MLQQVKELAEGLHFSKHLGIELVSAESDHVVLRLRYAEHLGVERINGGAISALADIAATCAFWSHAEVGADSRGATVGFSINFLRLVAAGDLTATASVRRRGGSICVGEVSVSSEAGEEIAIATVTYKLDP